MRNYQGVRVFQSAEQGDGTVKAAIAVLDTNLDIVQYPQLTTHNIVVVGIQTGAWKITLVSYYFEPDTPIGPYLEHLAKISELAGPMRLLIGGDANAKSPWWGSMKVDSRGEDMAGTLDEMGMQVLNLGDTPTFDTFRGGIRYQSHVDITACSADLLDLVEDWKVVENLTSSDHNGIVFNVNLKKSKGISIIRTTRIFNTRKANWGQFNTKFSQFKLEHKLTIEHINKTQTTQQLDSTIQNYTNTIIKASTHAIPKNRNQGILTIPWWTERLEEMRREVTTRRRRIRCASKIRRQKVVDAYLKKKEEYELEAARTHFESWKEVCRTQDKENIWSGIYRVIGRTTRREEDLPLQEGGKVLDAKNSVRVLAETFYPQDLEICDNTEHSRTRELAEGVNDDEQSSFCDPPFTLTELLMAADSFDPKKAPGHDGLTADICAHAIKTDPALFLAIINQCLAHHYFPYIWKEAVVVVLRKPGKESYTLPKSYRPIGLLPVLGKVYEKMIVARLKHHLIPKISTRQFGFMPQKSTEDALYTLIQYIRDKLNQKKMTVIVSLDIEGAFDSAWWPIIRIRLAEERCPVNIRRVVDSYLQERRVRVRYLGEEHERNTTKGCVQGSIAGPMLWNLILEG